MTKNRKIELCGCEADEIGIKHTGEAHSTSEPSEWEEIIKESHETYNGGWNEEETKKAFHHGMDTGFNISSKLLAQREKRLREEISQKWLKDFDEFKDNLDTLSSHTRMEIINRAFHKESTLSEAGEKEEVVNE